MPAVQSILAIATGLPIGLQLGMTGTGGALLAVPLLVYVVGVTVQDAAAISLVVVAISSVVGAWEYGRMGEVRGKATLAFTWTGVIGAWGGAYGNHLLPKELLLIGFGFMLLLARWLMIRQRKLLEHQEVKGTCAEHFPGSCWVKAAAVGFAVGLLNGFFGVGGGFMIVTALALSLGFPTRLAIGTSLSIIAVIALAGIAGHLGFGAPNGRLTILVVLGSVVGMLLGTRVARLAP
ncbi:MAG TPA: sulfite exporter TauE/SafE family protein, partial [Nitrospira sp.]|nr:sulfite exporter TauE/SafE family protein [Nitrospira sp.]